MKTYKRTKLIAIAGLLIFMGFLATVFGEGKSDGRFVSAKAFQKNLEKQVRMSPQTLKKLQEYGVTEQDWLKLEYFFYTDAADKAVALTEILRKKGYTAEHRPSAAEDKTFVITGWTTSMMMEESVLVEWTQQMCQLGFDNDCEFDGWGTYPDQE